MPGALIDRFLAEDCTDSVRALLLHEIDARSSGRRYLTFNVFNVLLDFDTGIATIEDELDVESSWSIPPAAFGRRLRGG
jgi:hypothetical protein